MLCNQTDLDNVYFSLVAPIIISQKQILLQLIRLLNFEKVAAKSTFTKWWN